MPTHRPMSLNQRAMAGLAQLLVTMALALFLPAGTVDYWQAWVFLAVFFVSVFFITVYLMRNDPALLERRVKAGPVAEKEKGQKLIQALASIAFIAVLVVPALARRFGWTRVPTWGIAVGNVLVALGLLFVFLVFKENTFTSAIVEVGADQKVISTGPYAVVRHPMYAGALLMLVGMPLALGSAWGLLAVLVLAAVIVWRLLAEEQFLAKNLSGYAEYQGAVRYRLVPWIW